MNHPTSRICVCVCVRLGNMCPIADCLFLLSFFFSETEDVAVAAGGLQIRQVYTYMGRVRGRLLRRSINSSALLSSIKNENRVGCFCEWLARLCPFFPPSLSDTQRRASRISMFLSLIRVSLPQDVTCVVYGTDGIAVNRLDRLHDDEWLQVEHRGGKEKLRGPGPIKKDESSARHKYTRLCTFIIVDECYAMRYTLQTSIHHVERSQQHSN